MSARFRPGQLVVSTAGRDKGKPFLIIGLEGPGYVLIADGRRRGVKRPKMKNVRHVRGHGAVAEEVAQILNNGRRPSDELVRRALAAMDTNLRHEAAPGAGGSSRSAPTKEGGPNLGEA